MLERSDLLVLNLARERVYMDSTDYRVPYRGAQKRRWGWNLQNLKSASSLKFIFSEDSLFHVLSTPTPTDIAGCCESQVIPGHRSFALFSKTITLLTESPFCHIVITWQVAKEDKNRCLMLTLSPNTFRRLSGGFVNVFSQSEFFKMGFRFRFPRANWELPLDRWKFDKGIGGVWKVGNSILRW